MVALPNRDRCSERREATRREILDCAWQIARADGLAAVTLRGVADLMGMRAPSLYSHVASKNAIYDAMFGQAWHEWSAALAAAALTAPAEPRRALLAAARLFVDFAAGDPVRCQLMSQPAIPNFIPSAEAYAASLEAYAQMADALRGFGVTAPADIDLWTALITGFTNQQLANDPGGERWRGQLPRLVDMYCDEVGIAGPALRSSR